MTYSDRLLLYLLATVHFILIICFIVYFRESLLKVYNNKFIAEFEYSRDGWEKLGFFIRLSYSNDKKSCGK